jgi:pyruvyltransferase
MIRADQSFPSQLREIVRTCRRAGSQSLQISRDRAVKLSTDAVRLAIASGVLGTSLPLFVPTFFFRGNLGDSLNASLVPKLLDAKCLRVSANYGGKLVAIGSTITKAMTGDWVVGAGHIRDTIVSGRGVHFFAVRGPLTFERIVEADVPRVFGDLALLAPDVLQPPKIRSSGVVVVPHYVDWRRMKNDDPGMTFLDVRASNHLESIQLIRSADLVISSSLHGIILAEAYGVPAVWVQASSDVTGDGFKFRDYYAGTNRDYSPHIWDPQLRFLRGLSASVPTESLTAQQEGLRLAVQKSRRAIEANVSNWS